MVVTCSVYDDIFADDVIVVPAERHYDTRDYNPILTAKMGRAKVGQQLREIVRAFIEMHAERGGVRVSFPKPHSELKHLLAVQVRNQGLTAFEKMEVFRFHITYPGAAVSKASVSNLVWEQIYRIFKIRPSQCTLIEIGECQHQVICSVPGGSAIITLNKTQE